MYFQTKDVQQYQQNKEFIDTAIVPLLSLDFSEDNIVKSSSEAEFLMALTAFVEQQFRGRLMLLPPYSYTEQTKREELVLALKQNIQEGGFKHVVFITCDHYWTKLQDELDSIIYPVLALPPEITSHIFTQSIPKVATSSRHNLLPH